MSRASVYRVSSLALRRIWDDARLVEDSLQDRPDQALRAAQEIRQILAEITAWSVDDG